LGIKYDASIEEIKRAYRKLCDKYAIDLRDSVLKQEAEERLRRIHKAYEMLMKKRLRFHRRNSRKIRREANSTVETGIEIPKKSIFRLFFEMIQKKM
jgi:DnaJ-class molecular chaperone